VLEEDCLMSFRSVQEAIHSVDRCACVASSNDKDTFVLDNIFALIDEYICADLSIDPSLFPCSRATDHTFRGTCSRGLS
jgi:hypothetical protein